MELRCQDGDSYPYVLGSLNDLLVEIERNDGTLFTGYVLVSDEGISLREFAGNPVRFMLVPFEDIKSIEVY